MGQLFEMNRTGHANVIKWGESSAEIEQARKTFDNYKSAGFTMFEMTDDDGKGRKMERFDPDVKGIIAVPRMTGG